MAYDHAGRKAIIDAAFRRFKSDFGYYPKSVESPYVATWTAATAPPASVTFTIDPATRGYKVRRDDEHHALRLIRCSGLVILVK